MENLNGNGVSPVRLKNSSAARETISGRGFSLRSTSIVIRFQSCRAIPRQSNPGPRFVVDAGTRIEIIGRRSQESEFRSQGMDLQISFLSMFGSYYHLNWIQTFNLCFARQNVHPNRLAS